MKTLNVRFLFLSFAYTRILNLIYLEGLKCTSIHWGRVSENYFDTSKVHQGGPGKADFFIPHSETWNQKAIAYAAAEGLQKICQYPYGGGPFFPHKPQSLS